MPSRGSFLAVNSEAIQASASLVTGHVIGGKSKRRPDGLLYIPLCQHPGYQSQCLILISLLVFRVLTFILVREQGLVGMGDEEARRVRGHVEECPLCACQRSHRNQNCCVNGEDKVDCVSQLIATVGAQGQAPRDPYSLVSSQCQPAESYGHKPLS